MFPIRQIRRNHALEHATLHLLARDLPQSPLAGYSYSGGIFIFGNVPTEVLRAALHEAEMRLRGGEHHLAIHPGCGTNLSLAFFLTTGLAWLPLRGRTDSPRHWGWRIPVAVLLAFFGLFLAGLLGPWAQKYLTTDANLGDLTILGVDRFTLGSWQVHHIRTGENEFRVH